MAGMLSSRDVARYLGISLQTLRRWVKKKEIPYRQIGRRLYFPKDEFEAWVDNMPGVKLMESDEAAGVGTEGQDQ